MNKESKQFLQSFLEQCGPSGFEEPAQKVWVDRTRKFADKVSVDVMGNAIAVLNPKAKFKVMLAGHCDEIGFIVTHINSDGFIYIEPLGGIDRTTVPGSEIWVSTSKGVVKGVIGKKAIHLETASERGKVAKLSDVYIDIGAKNKKDAQKRVEIGDTATYKPNYLELGNDIISSKACDDRAGGFIISEVLKILSAKKNKLNVGVYAVSTVQEETGLRGATTGAFGVNPDVGIAVDVTFSSDTPGSSKTELGDVQLGKGIVIHPGPANNRKLYALVKKTGKKKKIKFQIQTSGYPDGTDTAVIQLTREGVATVLLSIPNRYMHTQVETISIKDLESASKLIAETILSLKEKNDFIPSV